VAHKNPLYIGGNPDHITLGLVLWLTFYIIPSRTVLQLGEGRDIPAVFTGRSFNSN